MKIVFLDRKTIGDDLDLSAFEALGEVVKYDFSTPEESLERTEDADVIVLNKVEINASTIGKAKHLKLVCVTATGTNNLDKEYLAQRGIAWRNVAGYSTESVAQHTFAMLFYLLEKLPYYDAYVKTEKYVGDVSFTADRIAIKTAQVGEIGFRVKERSAAKVVFGAENSPVPMDIKIDLKELSEGECELTTSMEVDIPVFLRPMIGGAMQKAVDQFATLMQKMA